MAVRALLLAITMAAAGAGQHLFPPFVIDHQTRVRQSHQAPDDAHEATYRNAGEQHGIGRDYNQVVDVADRLILLVGNAPMTLPRTSILIRVNLRSMQIPDRANIAACIGRRITRPPLPHAAPPLLATDNPNRRRGARHL
jgi:hypothetical protein